MLQLVNCTAVPLAAVTCIPFRCNNAVNIIDGDHTHVHALQNPVVLLPDYIGIIIIIYFTVPVKTVTITPAGDNNVVYSVEGDTKSFTCTTDSSRPAAWIRWYIGGQNVTNQATQHPPQQDGDKFISSSSLVYTVRGVDHNKVTFCKAVNIERRQKIKSIEKFLYIQCK